jgi:DNA/RNA-binding domain of Phe-tRNA-synthetase-like protein
MKFLVSEECLQLGLRAGAILFRNVRIAPSDLALRLSINQQIDVIRARFTGPAGVRSALEIAAFRDILMKVGVDARHERPSVQRLLNFALKRHDLPAVNVLVDAYNLVSVRTCCSLGAHDLDRIELPVSLRLLTGRESFTPLGGPAELAVVAGEYGYVDAQNKVICRLDLLQAEFSKVTTDTKNVLLIVEGTAAHPPELLQQAMREVQELVTRHCGGSAEIVANPYS